jgi:hypothetical protein
MLSLLLLVSGTTFGLTLLRCLRLRLTKLEFWVWGTMFGLVVTAYAGLLSAYLAGWSSLSQLVTTIILLAIAAIMRLVSKEQQEFESIGEGKISYFFIIPVMAIVLFFGSTTLTGRDNEWWINNANNYGDIRLHLAYITNFVSGQNIPVENPIFSGTAPSYPFLINVLTSQMVSLGLSIPTAINITSLIFLSTIALVMYCFSLRLTGQRLIASMTPFLLFTCGGIAAFTLLLPDWAAHKFSLAYLAQTTHDYTIWGGYVFGNSVTTYFNPQRAFLLGFPMVMIIITELWKLTNKSSWPHYLFIGLCISTLPIVHTSSLLVVALLLPYFFVKSLKERRSNQEFIKNWALLVVPASSIGLLLLHLFISQTSSLTSYLRIQPNWIADQGPFPAFWLSNAGPALILSVYALVKARHKEPWQPFVAYCFILFLFGNFVITQPWDFDNSKYLLYWYACLTIALAWGLVFLVKKSRWGWPIAVIFLVLLSLTGTVDLLRRTQVDRNWYPIARDDEFELVLNLRNAIPPKSRVLTLGDKIDTVTPLLGRRLVFGDDPWLWSHGIKSYKQRIADVHTIYQGSPGAPELIQQYGVNYIIVSNNERKREPNLNEGFISSRYERVYTDDDDFNVYKVSF